MLHTTFLFDMIMYVHYYIQNTLIDYLIMFKVKTYHFDTSISSINNKQTV